MDLILGDARLVDGTTVDVAVADGHIASIEPAGAARPEGVRVDDLAGWLLLPAMAEPHAHLDKALTAEVVPNPGGDLAGAIEAWVANAHRFTPADIAERAARALEQLMVHGTSAVRTHVNVGEQIGTDAVRALADVRADFEGLVDMQIVALVTTPLTGRGGAGNRAALSAALDAGADLVGGCPHLDPDGPGLIGIALDAGADAGRPLDLHVDETLEPSMLTLRELARQVQDRAFEHAVAASHCVSLGVQAPELQAAVAGEVAAAGISVITLPATNLFLQGREHPSSCPRGLTAIGPLCAAGVTVAAGADNVQDPFNLVGRSDPLETATLLVMAGHVLPDDAYAMVSEASRAAMGLPPVTVSPGDPADLVAVDAASVREAIADAPMSRRLYRRGRLVACADQSTRVVRAGP